ncbi:hypothetical protein CP532_0571 [Ophiocordyceps camponoti-leonardi (nom. inval.)]|nr:hypothetical protein CP532_0571 [Ophiocordyceps camponoti-leonardi (nom. inval.)]
MAFFREPRRYHNEYYPPGVFKILACGSSAFIGEVDNATVLKYPIERGYLEWLEHEHRLLEVIGPHERIIGIAGRGLTEYGLYLERATNGNVFDFLRGHNFNAMSLRKRLALCRELTEAVAHIHSRNVLHCDLNPANVLLDEDLHVKLSDFQGCLLDDGGETVMSTFVGESWRYHCPSLDGAGAKPSRLTDIFALGSTMHFIILGEEVFSDIVTGMNNWDTNIRSRFARGVLPDGRHPLASITEKCWTRAYNSATEVVEDIKEVERGWANTFSFASFV